LCEPFADCRLFASYMNVSSATTDAVKTVAPEDLRVGDFVAILLEDCQYPTHYWVWFSPDVPEGQPVRLTFMPTDDIGVPLKVAAICLPFIAVENADGEKRSLDLRQCKLGRLTEDYVAATWAKSQS